MITVVFSAMTTESYINEYAIENFSRSFFDRYLDKLDVKSKWVVYPKLVTGKEIDRESQAFESLGKLMALRNRLVHDKTRRKRTCELAESDWVTEQEAEDRQTLPKCKRKSWKVRGNLAKTRPGGITHCGFLVSMSRRRGKFKN